MVSAFADFAESFRMRFIASKILSDGNPMNFLTQQLPTVAWLALTRLESTQSSIIGK
jgi:hypothetical protein